MLALAPTRLFDGERMLEGAGVIVRDGRIAELTPSAPPGALKLDGLLAPGLIDIQVNGGGGAMFNDAPTVETLRTIAAAHRRFGVTGFLATLISDERGKAAQAIAAVAEAIAAGADGLMGLHLEGPWLSQPRRGVHPSRHLRDLDSEDLALLAKPHPFPLLLTVAPEQIAPDSIRKLVSAGVTISLGHTEAPVDDVVAALDAGASGFTHLFNAMPALEGRNPGPVGAALASRDAWTGLILDGIHVHPVSARAAFAAKTARKLVLVSDAMATVGSSNPRMMLDGEIIEVKDGALRNAAGKLAGAHLDLSQAAQNAVSMLGATTEEALRMVSLTPAEFLRIGQERGRIAAGHRADLVLFDAALNPQRVWVGGEEVA